MIKRPKQVSIFAHEFVFLKVNQAIEKIKIKHKFILFII